MKFQGFIMLLQMVHQAIIKFWKIQLAKMVQLGEYLKFSTPAQIPTVMKSFALIESLIPWIVNEVKN